MISIDTVLVGDPNNPNDPTTGFGSVDHPYEIGKYEVTVGQYTEFLNAVANVTDLHGLYNANMAADLNIAGITKTAVSGGFSYSVIGATTNRPITYVSWFDAARFVNWVQNGATIGAGTETGAYTLNGATSGIINKNIDATWWLPSEDEWYKAAYYDAQTTNYSQYPTASNAVPGNTVGGAPNQANYYFDDKFSVTQQSDYDETINYLSDVGSFSASLSHYGTFDQGGNVAEWNDTVEFGMRGQRGGDWGAIDSALAASSGQYPFDPGDEDAYGGFRIATIPEPSSVLLLTMAGGAALLWWRAKGRA
ncbi:MAG: formylglycine-generating enzyme family protein [Terrimicrobiaceae bacterium]